MRLPVLMSHEHIDPAFTDRLREIARDVIARLGGQTRTAATLGVGQSTVSDWRSIPIQHVAKLAEILGCRPHDIRPDRFTRVGDLLPAFVPAEHTNRARMGRRLRYLRQSKGLTVEAMAASLGVSPGAVSQWETGANGIRPDRIPQIEHILGDTLVGDAPDVVGAAPPDVARFRPERTIDEEIERRIRAAEDEIIRLESTLVELRRERDALREGLAAIRAGRGEGS